MSTLNDETAAMTRFVALLEEEQAALLGNDTDRLHDLASLKTQAAERLASLIQARPANRNDLPTKVWANIRKLAAQAQHLNQTNGELIRLKLQYTQQALGQLQGAYAPAGSLYGRNGQTHISGSGRVYGKV
jgi:flagella synthesis protein FlgN